MCACWYNCNCLCLKGGENLPCGWSLHNSRSIFAKWCVCGVNVVLAIEEDVFELIKVEAAIAGLIVLFNHLTHLFWIHLLAQLLHGQYNVLLGNLARGVRIKLVEHGLQTGLSQEVPYINGGSQELTVVDAFVLVVIHLVNHVTNLLVAHIHSLCHKDVLQLACLDHTRSVLIDGLELRPQLLHFFLRSSLHEQVHRSLLES